MNTLNINANQNPSGPITADTFDQALESIFQLMRTRMVSIFFKTPYTSIYQIHISNP